MDLASLLALADVVPSDTGTGTGTGVSPADLSILHLVMAADPVVKVVLGFLVLLSGWCWTVMVEKALELSKAVDAAQRLEGALSKNNIDAMLSYQDDHPVAKIITIGNEEWLDGRGEHERESLHEIRDRVERSMRLALGSEVRRLSRRLPFLATVGSSAPFIGLFGTVWGIMDTFTSIAASHDTSLATVAPGIAEALIATAIGLAAAIPSIMAYNKFATDLGRYSGRLTTAIGVYAGRLSKRLAPPPPGATVRITGESA